MNKISDIRLPSVDGWSILPVSGEDHDVVVLSQVVLYRNFRKLPFPSSQNSVQAREILSSVELIIQSISSQGYAIAQASPRDDGTVQGMFLERYYCADFLKDHQHWYIDAGQNRVLRVNHLDHLEFLGIGTGLDLAGALEYARSWEQVMEVSQGFAASVEMGYLTSRVALAGPGMEARVILHLPGLFREDAIPTMVQNYPLEPLARDGLDYSPSHLFLLRGFGCLGQTEHDFLDLFTEGVSEIAHLERQARERLRDTDPLEFDDQSWRGWGNLVHHRLMGWNEALTLWSRSRMAWGMEVLPDFPREFGGLIFRLGENHLSQWLLEQNDGEKGSPKTEKMTILDEARSEIIRQIYAGGM